MVLTDTGYWLALANRNDKWHQRAVDVTTELEETLIVTWPVLTETCYLLLSRLGSQAQATFLRQIERNVDIFPLDQSYLPNIQSKMRKYADLPMDLADASLVVAADVLGEGKILSTDLRDFQTYRWKNHKPFKNILLPD